MEPIANIHFSDKKEDILKYFDSTLNATKMFQKLWTINDTMPRNNLTDNDLNYLNFVKYLSYHLYNPHDIAFIQWNPELYFPKITVPILILLGEKDNLIPFEKKLKGINDIVERYNKKNITVKVFNGHGHALVVDNQNSTEDQQAAINTPSTPDTTINWMADWIRGLD